MSDAPDFIDFTLPERCGASTANDIVAAGRNLAPGARMTDWFGRPTRPLPRFSRGCAMWPAQSRKLPMPAASRPPG